MCNETSIRALKRWYAVLLRLYPKAFRRQFAPSMEQTFEDMLRDRASTTKRSWNFVIWIFIETFSGMVREHMTVMMTHRRSFIRIAVVTGLLLLVPLVAMAFTDEVAWGPGDFLVAAVLIFGAGVAFHLIAGRSAVTAYRVATGVAVITALLLVWLNLAVGLIGDEGNPANLMYVGVLAVAGTGTLLARFRPQGMALTMVATALAQMLVAAIAPLAGWGSTLVINALFAGFWLISAWLFRRVGVSSQSKAQLR